MSHREHLIAAGSSEADARILIVDDQPLNAELLERLLTRAGFRNVTTATNGAEAVSRCLAAPPDLLLLDLRMPGLDGFDVLRALGTARRGDGHFPVVVLTGVVGAETRHLALAAGADDFLAKPFDPLEAILRARNLVALHLVRQDLRRDNARLEDLVRDRTRDLELARGEVLLRLALASEYRDDKTQQHAQRIGWMSRRLAEATGRDDDLVDTIERAAALHDIGKLAIPDAVLLKPGPLDPDERRIMEQHAPIGAQMLAGSRSPLLQLAEEIARAHHERWDGSGYPDGLAGAAIPRPARIAAIVDVYDALTHERPYKRAWPVADALAEIERGAGTQFDPNLTRTFIELGDHAAQI